MPEEFTEAAGEVIARQKPRRKIIEQRAALDAMYADPLRAG